MSDHDRVVKHLELIQGVVTRLGNNSFLLKGWSMTVLVGGSLLMVRMRSEQPLLALTLLVPVLGFWLLDAYYLWQERLFRAEYDRVRQQDETDFAMIPMQHVDKPDNSRRAAFWSETLRKFYAIEIVFVLILGLSLWLTEVPAPLRCVP